MALLLPKTFLSLRWHLWGSIQRSTVQFLLHQQIALQNIQKYLAQLGRVAQFPHAFQQFFACQHAARVLRKVIQQIEFELGQAQRLVKSRDLVGIKVDAGAAKAERTANPVRLLPANV